MGLASWDWHRLNLTNSIQRLKEKAREKTETDWDEKKVERQNMKFCSIQFSFFLGGGRGNPLFYFHLDNEKDPVSRATDFQFSFQSRKSEKSIKLTLQNMSCWVTMRHQLVLWGKCADSI